VAYKFYRSRIIVGMANIRRLYIDIAYIIKVYIIKIIIRLVNRAFIAKT
jgi:hypothetical protein